MHFNKEAFLAKIDYNQTVYKSLTELAISEYPVLIQKLLKAFEVYDKNEIISVAHKIKGGALSMEFEKMLEYAQEIEKNIEHKDIVAKLCRNIHDEWQKIEELI